VCEGSFPVSPPETSRHTRNRTVGGCGRPGHFRLHNPCISIHGVDQVAGFRGGYFVKMRFRHRCGGTQRRGYARGVRGKKTLATQNPNACGSPSAVLRGFLICFGEFSVRSSCGTVGRLVPPSSAVVSGACQCSVGRPQCDLCDCSERCGCEMFGSCRHVALFCVARSPQWRCRCRGGHHRDAGGPRVPASHTVRPRPPGRALLVTVT
jgi:hypothetical protein